jgi:hypothetical protein
MGAISKQKVAVKIPKIKNKKVQIPQILKTNTDGTQDW